MYQIKCANPDQRSMFYSDSESKLGNACVGHLRMDFGSGNEFFSTWWGNRAYLNTQKFRDTLDSLVSELRKTGLLRNREEMQHYCDTNPSLCLDESYGFSVETDEYLFLLRCRPRRDNYDCYCYCYNKNKLPQDQS